MRCDDEFGLLNKLALPICSFKHSLKILTLSLQSIVEDFVIQTESTCISHLMSQRSKYNLFQQLRT